MGIIKDSTQIVKIVMAVASLQQYQWVEQRKSEAEVEIMLKNKAQKISGK